MIVIRLDGIVSELDGIVSGFGQLLIDTEYIYIIVVDLPALYYLTPLELEMIFIH